MNILLVNGSGGSQSTNKLLLSKLPFLFPNYSFLYVDYLTELPLFHVDIKDDQYDLVDKWLYQVQTSDAVIFSTPEYLHNLPALLKNALEWTTESGVFESKKVIAMTYTPHAPRGEKAMVSIINSLNALNAKILIQFALYHNDLSIDVKGNLSDNGGIEMIEEALGML